MAVLTPRYFTFVCGNKPKFSYSDDIHRILRNRVAKVLIALISERYGFGLDYPKEGGRLATPLPPNDHPLRPLLDTVILPLFTEQTPLTKVYVAICSMITVCCGSHYVRCNHRVI